MNCPSCGAPMCTQDGVFKCDYCHSIVVPNKDDEGVSITTEAEGEVCPVCALPLMKATLGTLPLLICTRCDGMVIAMDEFEDLIAASRVVHPGTVLASPANPSNLRRTMACPRCHRPMEAHFYAGPGNVVIDTCEFCSLNWLDHGSLSRIAQAPASDFAPTSDSDSDSDSDASYPETSATHKTFDTNARP